MEVTRFGGRGEYNCRPHLVMVESGTNSLLGPLPCSKNRSLIPHIIGKAMAALTLIGPIYLPSMHERRAERTHKSQDPF